MFGNCSRFLKICSDTLLRCNDFNSDICKKKLSQYHYFVWQLVPHPSLIIDAGKLFHCGICII